MKEIIPIPLFGLSEQVVEIIGTVDRDYLNKAKVTCYNPASILHLLQFQINTRVFSTDKAFFIGKKPGYQGTPREVAGTKALCIYLSGVRKMVYTSTQNTLRAYAKWRAKNSIGAG